MGNPLENFLSELFSINGFLTMIIVIIFAIIFFTIIGVLKESNFNNDQLNDTLTTIEENTTSSIKWYFIASGIIGTIVLFFLGYKAFIWILNSEYNNPFPY